MIIWGGTIEWAAGPPLNTGARYNPATQAWSPMTTIGAPTGRYDHTAVWTGREMIVWGGTARWSGSTNPDPFSSGARYNPATDSWSALSAVGAPLGLYSPVAIWTGQEMIVWGPSGTEPNLRTAGGRYDPATDSWSPMTDAGAPTPRYDATAVWTRTEMIVWGGTIGPAWGPPENTGARYNPATNTWSPVSTVGSPSARYSHTAVWTGSEMVVWGGEYDNQTGLNTGARYNPSTDRWAAMSLSGAPVGRALHTSVWTGTEMIIWGGHEHKTAGVSSWDESLNTGARYNPSADTWAAILSAGAPQERISHASVWTGAEMIVWGGVRVGYYDEPRLGTGGRYGP